MLVDSYEMGCEIYGRKGDAKPHGKSEGGITWVIPFYKQKWKKNGKRGMMGGGGGGGGKGPKLRAHPIISRLPSNNHYHSF